MKELSELLEGIEVEDDEFIPKSKIKNKIKELERCCSNEPIIIEYQIAILKELLGDDE